MNPSLPERSGMVASLGGIASPSPGVGYFEKDGDRGDGPGGRPEEGRGHVPA